MEKSKPGRPKVLEAYDDLCTQSYNSMWVNDEFHPEDRMRRQIIDLTDDISLICNQVAQASMLVDSEVITGKKHQEQVARLVIAALALAKITGTSEAMVRQTIRQ